MATAKKQLAATVAAGAKKPAARPAATPAPRPAPRPAPLPGIGQMEALRKALNGVPQQPSMPYPGPRFPGVGLPGFGGDPRFPGVGIPQFPQRPIFSDDYGRPPLVSVPRGPGGTFDPSLDPIIKAYLDRQRKLSAMDAGVAYSFDPATQTFRGETMGGPVTMSLQDMQRAAAQDLARQAGKPGFGGMLGLQGVGPRQMPSFMTQVLPDPMEVQRMQAEQAAKFARDLQMGRTGGMTQEAFAAQQAAERQRYAQQLQAQEMARQARMPGYANPYLGGMPDFGGGMPDYMRPYFTGLTGLGSAGPLQLPVRGGGPRQMPFPDFGMPGYARPYLGGPISLGSMGPMQPGMPSGPTGPGSAGPMQPPVGGMPGFGGDPRFPGPGQMPQISGRLPSGAYAQQGPTTQAQPRPAAPSNYGGFNSIQGMGANQYGGFNTPPMPQQQFAQNQAGLGQMQNQQQFAQNQAGNMFGSFGAAAQPAQNQGPNQQAQAAGQAAAPLAGGLF